VSSYELIWLSRWWLLICVPDTSLSRGGAEPPHGARCGVSALPLQSRKSLRAWNEDQQVFKLEWQ
jgi:hypothetical protein